MTKKQNIRHFSKEEIIEFFKTHGEQAFRAKQVYEWLWKKHSVSFNEMTSYYKITSLLMPLLPAKNK